MTAPVPTPDAVLRLCAGADPWFPSDYARATGTDRDALDEPLARLRLSGLVRIGGWEAGKGQWYTPTDAGRAILADPRALDRLRDGDAVPLPPAERPPRAGRLSTWDRGEAVREAVFARGGTPMTWTILAGLVAVFLVGLALALRRGIAADAYMEKGTSPVQDWLFVSAWTLGAGQWWRLLTYSVVHGGLLHLVMNGMAVFALGPLMERALGSGRFLVLWLLGALGGGVAVALAGPHGAVGASGAICALLTAAVAFVWINRRHLGADVTSDALRRLSMGVILTALISFSKGVSWQAHLGGAVAGVVGGVLLTYHRFGTAEQRWAALLGLVLLPLAGVAPLVERHILKFQEAPPDERADFGRQVVPVVEQVRAHAAAVSDEIVDPLRYRRADERGVADVNRARAELAALAREQSEAQTRLGWAGPYRTVGLEQARVAGLTYVTDRMKVTKALDTCLSRGRDWAISDQRDLDETRLQMLLNETLEAELRWRRLAGAALAEP